MSDKLENCPVCKNKLNEHRVQDFIDCIQRLFEKNERTHSSGYGKL